MDKFKKVVKFLWMFGMVLSVFAVSIIKVLETSPKFS